VLLRILVTIKPNVVVGLDLAGSPKRPTGFCLLRGAEAETSDLFTDDEILDAVRRAAPSLVAIDAPLNLPPGRTSIHERNDSHYRVCDLELRKRGIPFFPITLGPMRSLTERGIRLRRELDAMNIRVIEMYPGGAQDVWRIPRVHRDRAGLRRGLARLGLKDLRRGASDHELDAATGALVGRDFLAGKAEVYGNFEEGAIVMPAARPAARKKPSGTSSRPGGSAGRPFGSPAAEPGIRRGPGCRGTRR
jgi:predicted nuclease with RNAse H fold